MQKVTILIFLLTLKLYGNNNLKKIVIPVNASKQEVKASILFAKRYFETYQKTLVIKRINDPKNEKNTVFLQEVSKFERDQFCVEVNQENLFLKGKGYDMILYAVEYFFNIYGNLESTPDKINDCQIPDFKYREVYFSNLYNNDFLLKHKLINLDNYWNIWGHNLAKVVKKYKHTNNIYATVNGVKKHNQFCFSSEELENILTKEIELLGTDGNYVIAPNDNLISCISEKSKKLGNTKTDASPSVFYLLEKLAKKFPKSNFYTIAYHTVKSPPNKPLPNNVGVFFSTVNYQKAIPLASLKDFEKLKQEIINWKQKVSSVFIWDYVLNFDNYNDFYPILLTAQQNLKLYKKLGISGVFFNGSEQYAVLEKLKTTVLSKLLWNTSANVKDEIKYYFQKNYPKKIAALLYTYYIEIEEKSFQSPKKMSIYSSISKAQKKYLKAEKFHAFFNNFKTEFQQIRNPKPNVIALMKSLTFLKLELTRSNMHNTFCNENTKTETIELIASLLRTLQKTNTIYWNESKEKYSDYLQEWLELIMFYKCDNSFFNQPFRVLSSLDEDYSNPKILNDGNLGFLNYNTNWLIVSKDNLIIELNEENLKNKNEIGIRFLNDKKHKIFLPECIEVFEENSLLCKILVDATDERMIREVTIPIKKEMQKSAVKIFIKRRNHHKKSALACDEIIIK